MLLNCSYYGSNCHDPIVAKICCLATLLLKTNVWRDICLTYLICWCLRAKHSYPPAVHGSLKKDRALRTFDFIDPAIIFYMPTFCQGDKSQTHTTDVSQLFHASTDHLVCPESAHLKPLARQCHLLFFSITLLSEPLIISRALSALVGETYHLHRMQIANPLQLLSSFLL